MSPTLRLDRLLANMGYGSRREVQAMVANGRVMLDGVPAAKADIKIAVAPDLPERMQIDGRRLDPAPGLALMLHKPLGVTCSHKEAGPLTDDGALLHKIISPRHHVAKRYRATLARPLAGDEAERFASGALMLEGEDKPLAPALLEPLGPTGAYLTVTEGRYHQVRRMFAAVGNHVEALHRDRIGALDLPAGGHALVAQHGHLLDLGAMVAALGELQDLDDARRGAGA